MQLIRRVFGRKTVPNVKIEGTVSVQGRDLEGNMVYLFRPSNPRAHSSYECTILDSMKLHRSEGTKLSAAVHAELIRPCANELPTSRKFVFEFVFTTDPCKFNYVVAVKRLD